MHDYNKVNLILILINPEETWSVCAYRQVVAAVAADQCELVGSIGWVSFSLQSCDTQKFELLQ